MAERVLIIGGGVAGCCLASILVARGKRVTVLERAHRLGGRAGTIRDHRTGDLIEIGSHLIMGCYAATRRFAHSVRADEDLVFQNRLSIPFQVSYDKVARFTCQPLPAPLHVAVALLRFSCLKFGDRWAGLRIGPELSRRRRLGSDRLDGETAADWLSRSGQTDMTLRLVWEPLCLSALNLPLESGSAKLFANVLVEAFCRSQQDSRLGWVRDGLGTLCDVQARTFIEGKGGLVLSGMRVQRLLLRNGRVTGAEVQSSQNIEADAVVSTLAPWDLLSLLSSSGLAEMAQWKDLSRFEPSPILTLNLWLDREITDHHFVHLHGKRFHWLFDNAPHMGGRRRSSPCYSLLVSGPNPLIDCPKAEIEAIAMEDIIDLFPIARDVRVLRTTVSKQRQATYAPYPGLETFRPGPQTPIPGLYLAGDWTATGLPATVESACRSAEAVAFLLK